MTDRRKRPWRTLRCVVEVTVPPMNRAQEKDLVYAVRESLPDTLSLPRPIHADHRDASVRVKAFGPYYRAEKVKERKSRK